MSSTPLRYRFDEAVAAQVRAEILHGRLTLDELSAASGLSRAEIRDKLSGRGALTTSELGALASSLGTTGSMLVSRAERDLEARALARGTSSPPAQAPAAAEDQPDEGQPDEGDGKDTHWDEEGAGEGRSEGRKGTGATRASRERRVTDSLASPPTASVVAPPTGATRAAPAEKPAGNGTGADDGGRHAGASTTGPSGHHQQARSEESLARAGRGGVPGPGAASTASTPARRARKPSGRPERTAEDALDPSLKAFIAHVNRRLHEAGYRDPTSAPSQPGQAGSTSR